MLVADIILSAQGMGWLCGNLGAASVGEARRGCLELDCACREDAGDTGQMDSDGGRVSINFGEQG